MTAIPCQLSISWWSWKGKRQISLCVSCDKVRIWWCLSESWWLRGDLKHLLGEQLLNFIYFQPMHAWCVQACIMHAWTEWKMDSCSLELPQILHANDVLYSMMHATIEEIEISRIIIFIPCRFELLVKGMIV